MTILGSRLLRALMVLALLEARTAVLCVFRLLPNGFTNADLRRHLAPLLGEIPGT